MTFSLRQRLLLGTILSTTLIFTLAACLLYHLIARCLLGNFDAALGARAQALAALVEQNDQGIRIDLEPDQMPEFRAPKHPFYFVLWDHSGKLLASSLSSQNTSLLQPPAPTELPPSRTFRTLPTGLPGRQLLLPIYPHQEEDDEHPLSPTPKKPALLLVAGDTQDLNSTIAGMGWLLGGVFAGAILLTTTLMFFIVHHGIKPVGILAERIHAVGTHELSERLPLNTTPPELTPVVNRLNELLAKLETAFNRERAFTSDVAHELRTPLAGLTSALEIAITRPRSPEEYHHTIHKCLPALLAMRQMVENLLTLTRADARLLPTSAQPLPFENFCRETWLPYAPTALQRALQITWSFTAPLAVSADPGLLRIILTNLFDNAVNYTNHAGHISLTALSTENTLTFTIRNSGSQIAPQDAPLVFQRFWRGDSARSPNGQHCGLGLALSQRLTTLLGGQLSAQSTLHGDFAITLTLPIPP